MKTVILKQDTIVPILAGTQTVARLTYEVLDIDTQLVEIHTVHLNIPDASETNMFEYVEAAKRYCIDYCVNLEQTLNAGGA